MHIFTNWQKQTFHNWITSLTSSNCEWSYFPTKVKIPVGSFNDDIAKHISQYNQHFKHIALILHLSLSISFAIVFLNSFIPSKRGFKKKTKVKCYQHLKSQIKFIKLLEIFSPLLKVLILLIYEVIATIWSIKISFICWHLDISLLSI